MSLEFIWKRLDDNLFQRWLVFWVLAILLKHQSQSVLLSKRMIPSTFYIFVSEASFLARHNLQFTNTFASAGWMQAQADIEFAQKFISGHATYSPFIPNQPDCRFLSPFCMSMTSNYRVENDAEYYRHSLFTTLPSRFSAIYAFGDYDSCLNCSSKYGWDIGTVREFVLIPDQYTRITRANMEVISLARLAYQCSSIDAATREAIWNHYWSGGGEFPIDLPALGNQRSVYNPSVIWEYLIEGQLQLKTP